MSRRGGGRRRGGGGGGGGGHDTSGSGRWMVSYMDMVTVIMCLFIVLFAISSVDQDKYQELKSSLAAGFGTIEGADVVEATIDTPGSIERVDIETDIERAMAEVDKLAALRDAMSEDLEAHGKSDTVRFEIDERGLTVRLVSADTFFAPGSAELTEEALFVLRIVGPVLAPTVYEIQVEGNADYLATVGSQYPTNWELSSSRATAVLRHMVEQSGLTDHRVGAIGFGSARPLAEGTSPEALAANRRVDIMVLSAQPEAVRALIPDVLSGVLTEADVAAAEAEARAELAAAQGARPQVD